VMRALTAYTQEATTLTPSAWLMTQTHLQSLGYVSLPHAEHLARHAVYPMLAGAAALQLTWSCGAMRSPFTQHRLFCTALPFSGWISFNKSADKSAACKLLCASLYFNVPMGLHTAQAHCLSAIGRGSRSFIIAAGNLHPEQLGSTPVTM